MRFCQVSHTEQESLQCDGSHQNLVSALRTFCSQNHVTDYVIISSLQIHTPRSWPRVWLVPETPSHLQRGQVTVTQDQTRGALPIPITR